jgi:hypothetical protein
MVSDRVVRVEQKFNVRRGLAIGPACPVGVIVLLNGGESGRADESATIAIPRRPAGSNSRIHK